MSDCICNGRPSHAWNEDTCCVATREQLKSATYNRISALEEENRIMRDCLKSISTNTCCDKCQEAALWAREALAKVKGNGK